jgi:hypothetical protein
LAPFARRAAFCASGRQRNGFSFNSREERKTGRNHRLNLDLVPEAFVGRPDAPLVLLGNISGVSETGGPPSSYRLEQAFKDRMRNNLLHIDSDRPFPYFDPAIMPPGEHWWDRKLKHVLAEFGDGDSAKSILGLNMLAVDFFPYVSWSNRYAHQSLDLPSQEYSFDLVRNAVKQEAVVVLPNRKRQGLGHPPVIVFRHGERRWSEKVKELMGYHHRVRLKSYQSGALGPNNCRDSDWSHIQELARKIRAMLRSG